MNKLESIIRELEQAAESLTPPFMTLPEDGVSGEKLAYRRGARDAYIKVVASLREIHLSQESQISIAKRYYIREEGETTEEAIQAHCNGGFESLKEAEREAPKNVDFGAKWDVVDRNGKIYASGVAPQKCEPSEAV